MSPALSPPTPFAPSKRPSSIPGQLPSVGIGDTLLERQGSGMNYAPAHTQHELKEALSPPSVTTISGRLATPIMVSVGDSTFVREHRRMEALRLSPSSLVSSPFSPCRSGMDQMSSDGTVPVEFMVATKPSSGLDQLVEALALELAAQKREGRRDIERVREIMASWDSSNRETWAAFAQFDPDKAYTRNLIATDNANFTLMMLCWNKGRTSPVHDHAQSECWVRVVSGTALEELYETDPDANKPLRLKKASTFGPGAVTHIHDAMGIHRLGNADSENELLTLHCYAPPFKTCHIFPDQMSRGVECTMTFYSEHGKKHSDEDATKSGQANPCGCP